MLQNLMPLERATIIAALQLLQRTPDSAKDGAQTLSADEIGALCERLGTVVSAPAPVVVLETDNGVINRVCSTVPVRVIVLDDDTESGDESNVLEVHGEERYVTDMALTLSEDAENGFDGVAPRYVQTVLQELDKAYAAAEEGDAAEAH